MAVSDRFPVGSRCWYLQWNPARKCYHWQRVEVVKHGASRVGVQRVREGKLMVEPLRYVLPFSLTDSEPTVAAREICQ